MHENEICERFVCFAELEDFSGQGIAKQILSILAEIGLDIDCMVGQGYDGAAAMSGIKNGVQKHVRDVCSSAVYTHCAAHSLNLCLLKAAEIPEIQKAVTLMYDIAAFFKDSSKRQKVLELRSTKNALSPGVLVLNCIAKPAGWNDSGFLQGLDDQNHCQRNFKDRHKIFTIC